MDEPSHVGRTISHYRITERLGGGGMGVVYKAVDVRLNRFVALKFLSANLTRDPDAKERFIHEAQAASALDHPNICTIHEIDETPERELFLTLAYYDGETLKKRIERGPLPIDEAVNTAEQIAQALSRAHDIGIIHRDIKPANVMLPKDGPVKLVDFGLAKLVGQSDLTKTGTTVGTVAYMAPEQIRGVEPGPPADVWAIGVVLYEMLTGKRPFEGKDDLAVVSRILDEPTHAIGTLRAGLPDHLQRIVARALEKEVAKRYPSAAELLADLQRCRAEMAQAGPVPASISQILRRPAVAIAVVALVVAAVVPAAVAYRRASRTRWARHEGLPGIMKLVGADDYAGAFALATQVDELVPGDPVLANLWPQFSASGTLTTEPAGADAYVQAYTATGDAWRPLGRTPVKGIRLPRGTFRFKIEKEGYTTRLIASTNPGNMLGNVGGRTPIAITIPLSPRQRFPEMVQVAGGLFPVGLSGFNLEAPQALDPFWIDRDEVTNRAFKRFIEAGGYGKPEYWDGISTEPFRDSTGRPGPSTWELGEYPSGQADYPVGGVSWFEALAYCRSEGKTLPTLYHWARAGLSPVEIGSPLAPSIIPLSNFTGKGAAVVESFHGLGPYGTYDMAGNVREWIWNESASGRRWILGGSSHDQPYMFVLPNSLPPDDRSAVNGLRCARYSDDKAVPAALLARVESSLRDYRTVKAVSDEVYGVFKRQMAYTSSSFDSRVESKTDSSPDSVVETLSYDAGYEETRVRAYLALPRHTRPPYQLVVLFPGVGAFIGRAPSEPFFTNSSQREFIVKSGRAFVMPVYKGSFERWDPFLTLPRDEYLRAYSARFFQWRQDLGRLLDVLTARSDIDRERIAYWGSSFGTSSGSPLLALEQRLRVAVLAPAGLTFREVPPEADAINYVAHVTLPVLMIGGRHDYIFPLETSQKPLFERLGTPADRKRHVVFDTGHGNFPRSELIREVLGWLDKYLGPVQSTNP